MIGKVLICGGALWALLVGVAIGGDNNYLYLTQTSDGPLGNSFYADQSHSIGSSITASQSGDGNIAHIVMNDLCSDGLATPCASINLTQNNSGHAIGPAPLTFDGAEARNYVNVTTSGNSTATVTQAGDGNSATLSILDGQGLVQQSGDGNVASLTVRDGTNGTITQNDGHNSAALEVTGARGAGASLAQTGGQVYLGPVVVDTPTAGFVVTIVQN